MGNQELFQLYDKELILRLRNAKNLRDTRKILARFIEFLGSHTPSTECFSLLGARFYTSCHPLIPICR